jgi:hypothetical protein
MATPENFNETCRPPIEKLHSSLNNENIIEEENQMQKKFQTNV